MPFFGLKNARKKITSSSLSSLGLRKTQSTGNIENSIVTVKRQHFSSSAEKPATVSILRTSGSSGTTASDQKRRRTPPSQSDIVLATVMEDDDDDHQDDRLLAAKLRDITACDMDLLLSLETQARMDVQEEKERKQQEIISSITTKRPSMLKFDIPVTPPRSKSPDPKTFHATRPRRWSLPEETTNTTTQQRQQQADGMAKKKSSTNRLSKWSRLIKQQQQEEAKNNRLIYHNESSSSSSSSDDDCCTPENNSDVQTDITIGSKVKLFKRPLPIIGTVKYIGKVHFDTGEWLGIELDSRVGNTDGKIDDKRYFQTNLHCGIFVKKEDTIKV
ncbi:hypothetical protein [Parasitella parasitica]|uniref:CAP-Gly domain-containing protein n=1 Tax=Parasitella parasitica TaxID=35722 RepID=A0A0B7NC03_9FUNG|nr:hypothetical protein [Parasitella parasitica]